MDSTPRRARAVEPLAHPRPRLLACDIDGTLLDHLGVLRPAVVRAVAAIAATGVEVIIATGRSPWTNVAEIAAALGLSGFQITMQGALISDVASGGILRRRSLSAASYLHALRFAEEHALDPIVSLLDGHRAGHGIARDAWGRPPEEGPTFQRVPDLRAIADQEPMRVFLPIDPPRFAAVREAALAWAGDRCSVVWSDGAGLEFLAPGVHKGSALTWYAAHLRIPIVEVAAVGDGSNDRELLSMAGRSAAMGDAGEDLRSRADIVVPPASETGILHAFAWFFPDLADRLLDAQAA
ncbi:MAG: HAD family hydrolase [Chloroflexota bacterium]